MLNQSFSKTSKILAVSFAVILVVGSVVGYYAYSLYSGLFSVTQNVVPQVSPTPTLTPSPQPPSSGGGSSQQPNTSDTIKTTLADAIAKGYVQTTFRGRGGCCGDCITLSIKSLVPNTLELTPPASGALLASTTGSVPDMVIYNLEGIHHEANDTYTPTATIVLTDQNEVEYMFRAFCLDYQKSNPQSSDTFNLSGTASADVVKALNGLSGLAASVTNNEAIQVAIWAVTQNISYQELSDHFSDGLYEIENAKDILTAAGIDTAGKQLFMP